MHRLVRSTGIVALSTAASRVLGLARDVLMASFFSATGSTDAFYIAFRIPNLVRRLVSEGVLTVSFIPVYTEYLLTKDGNSALDLARKTLTLLMSILAVLTVLGWVFAPSVVHVIAMGFDDPAQVGITVTMFRIMVPYLLAAGFLAFCMGYLNSHRNFFGPGFAPVLLNVGIITGILALTGLFPEPLYGVSIGVLLGGLLQIALQVPYMFRAGFKFRLDFDARHPGVKRIFRTGLIGIFSMGSQQINILTATLMASFLAPGSVSYLYFSDRLHELVVGVTVVSIGNVVLPEMSAHSARKDLPEMMNIYTVSMRTALFMAIPATAALMIAGYPIISVLLMHNRFTAFEAEMTYRALYFASIGIVGIAVTRITIPAYFSLGETKTPLVAALASFIVNAVSAFFLMRTPLAHGGLTLATALAVTVQMMILLIVFKIRFPAFELKRVVVPAAQYAAASAAMGVCIWFLSGLVDWNGAAFAPRLLMLITIVVAGFAVYVFSCLALRAPEPRSIIDHFLKGRRISS